jgi:4-aminobutyrate aminotransferase
MHTDTLTPPAPAAARNYPRILVTPPGPEARAVIEKDSKYTSTSLIKEYPLVIERGQGVMVEDADGNRYLDFMAGIAVSATGYSHPAIVDAIKTATDKFLHICGTDFYYAGLSELCERLAKNSAGPSKKRVFLSNSGTEAIDGAIKLVRNSTRRSALIAFEGAFHGRTYGGMSLTSRSVRQRAHYGPFVPEVYHVPFANPYRNKFPGEADVGRAAVDYIENDLFQRQIHPEDVAAIFVEPIQGEGGYVIPPNGFLRGLRELCDKHGILLVCDEIQSGVGRTGKMWACEHEGVEPDVICTAKGLGSGMPIGAIIARESIMKWEQGAHGSTFGGNPVCCAAAIATLDLIEGGLMDNARVMGERMLEGVLKLQKKHKVIGDVRGRGLMVGMEFVKDRATKEPAEKLVDDIVSRAFGRGLLLLGAGKSSLRLAPPLVIDGTDIDVGLKILDECITELT